MTFFRPPTIPAMIKQASLLDECKENDNLENSSNLSMAFNI